MDPKISILVLSWNGWEDTIECVESLFQVNYPNYDIIVVDNHSSDGSVQKIISFAKGEISCHSNFFKYNPENKPLKVFQYTNKESEIGHGNEEVIKGCKSNEKLILIKNDENFGFGEGNNIGIRFALKFLDSDYIILLNNDSVVHPDFLTEFLKVIADDHTIGVAGSKMYNYYEPSRIDSTGGKAWFWLMQLRNYGLEEDLGQYEKIVERDFVYANSMIVKREVFEKVGLEDPYFFYGIEEYDFCIRAKRGGFKIMYVPKSIIWHKSGRSRKKLEKDPETTNLIGDKLGFFGYKAVYKLTRKNFKFPLFIIPFTMYYIGLIPPLILGGSPIRAIIHIIKYRDVSIIISEAKKRWSSRLDWLKRKNI